ncbi:TPA: hypothetical protein DDZ86_00590 [Candidatus Dependentiae bacterium]|nr:MAG: Beta-lactamase AmpC (Class C) [candidate division TM6 bacterium GW2011_GWF2_43_87]HBL98121.1 hypothetical protein [Candidatus Dependentiae bacterium]
MKRRFLFVSILVIQFGCLGAGIPGYLPKKLRYFVESIESGKQGLQGVGIAILYQGHVVYKTVSGFRRGGEGVITAETLFPLASVSKVVSATAIALLVEDRRVDLERKVRLPWIRPAVNLRHLLSHTTGYQFTGNAQIERGLSRPIALKVLKKQKQVYKAGCVYFYSNILFSLVDELLQRQNTSLHEAIGELQLKLGTKGIQILPLNPDYSVAYPHNRVPIGCKGQGTRVRPLAFPPYYPKTVPAAAGVFASLDGMVELLKLWCGYRPDLAFQRTLRKFYCPRVSTSDAKRIRSKIPRCKGRIKSFYGLGWRIFRAERYPGKDLVCHTGYIAGVNAFIGFIPFEDVGIVILVNEDNGFARTEGFRFWSEFLK